MNVTAWVLSVLGLVLVGTLVDLMLTKSKLKNYIRSVFATITVLVMITPLPALLQNGIKDGSFDINMDLELDGSYLDSVSKKKLSLLAEATENALEGDGIKGVKITVEGRAEGDDIRIDKVTVNLSNSVIDDKYQHINKNELVRERTAKYLNVTGEKITVYE